MTPAGRRPRSRADPTAAARPAGSRLKVAASMSTNTGVAPRRATTSAVATKLKVGTNTACAGPDPPRQQGQQQGVGAAGTAHGVGDAAPAGQRLLQLCHLGAQDELPVLEHRRHRHLDVGAEAPPLGGQVDEGNLDGLGTHRPRHPSASSAVGISSSCSGPTST